MTWLRDQKYDEADKAYREAAENAHAMGQWVWEARAYRIMAMYQTDHETATKGALQPADAVLVGRKTWTRSPKPTWMRSGRASCAYA